jgi:hypothetical protein
MVGNSAGIVSLRSAQLRQAFKQHIDQIHKQREAAELDEVIGQKTSRLDLSLDIGTNGVDGHQHRHRPGLDPQCVRNRRACRLVRLPRRLDGSGKFCSGAARLCGGRQPHRLRMIFSADRFYFAGSCSMVGPFCEPGDA